LSITIQPVAAATMTDSRKELCHSGISKIAERIERKLNQMIE
jgi:hypothetical protein